MDLSRSTAVVTGAGAGLGAIIAEHLSEQGAFVIVIDVDPNAAAATAERIGGQAVVADVATPVGRAEIVAVASRRVGSLLLVNNAGGWGTAASRFPDADEAQWRAIIELNLLGPMALIQLFLAGGRLDCVVNISSSAANGPADYGSPEYAVSKAGLLRLTTAVAGHPGRARMNCIVPGWIGLPRAQAEVACRPPAERVQLVDPADIAHEVVRLSSDDTQDGQVIIIGE